MCRTGFSVLAKSSYAISTGGDVVSMEAEGAVIHGCVFSPKTSTHEIKITKINIIYLLEYIKFIIHSSSIQISKFDQIFYI